jgi:predicted transcriptional regulator YdeE
MNDTLTHLQALEHSTWQEFYAKGKELQRLKAVWIAAYNALVDAKQPKQQELVKYERDNSNHSDNREQG